MDLIFNKGISGKLSAGLHMIALAISGACGKFVCGRSAHGFIC
ncbi:Uncharacterised protein [Mycobacteroides abscessus subsp. abscessus]|nr:Uncharacterised protein [Mycobacteroides abscessus subsp. abscessus]